MLIHPSKKVLNVRDNLFTNESLVPSLGIACIASACRDNSLTPDIIDLRLAHRTIENALNYIKAEKPIAVGLSAFTNEVSAAGEVARVIKSHFPEVPIVLGGPHASVLPEETLKEFGEIDCVVVGEGEKTFIELLRVLNSQNSRLERLRGVKGIAFQWSGLRQSSSVYLPRA